VRIERNCRDTFLGGGGEVVRGRKKKKSEIEDDGIVNTKRLTVITPAR